MAGTGASCSLCVSRQEMVDCSIPVWYPKFENITFESIFIPLSLDFLKYLKSDGIILPQGCSLPSHKNEAPMAGDSSELGSETDEEEEERWSDTDSDSEDKQPCFPGIVEKIETAIAVLGGRVLPKLNWSTPRDASWLLPGNTLQCRSPGEVILLLKSSDFVAHDLIHIFDDCSDKESCEAAPTNYVLCLRKWAELHPSSEFRCFVRNHSLIAISQRGCSSCYRHLASQQEEVKQEVTLFFQSHIRNKFPAPNYVFDVWRASEGDIRLVDFNPFCLRTDPLLFSWEELSSGRVTSDEGGAPEVTTVMRVVQSGASIRSHDLQEYRYPRDALDLARGEDVHKLIDILSLRNEGDKESDLT